MTAQTTLRRHWISAIVAALFLVSLAAGCGGGTGHSGAATPTRVNGPSSRFDDLPRYPRSAPTGARVRDANGVLVQTFSVPGTTPQEIVQYMLDVLPRHRWTRVTTSSGGSENGHRLLWRDGRLHLVLAVAAASTLQEGGAADQPTSQYSYLLYPAGVPVDASVSTTTPGRG